MIIRQLDNTPFGAMVTDIDCAQSASFADELRLELHRHQLLIFPNQQHLTPQQEVGFFRALDIDGGGVWRDQQHNPWEVFKVEQGNRAGTYQIPDEPAVLVLGKGDIDHFGLKVRLGGDRNARDRFAGHQWYDLCVEFCARWDQPSFDPGFVSDDLGGFAEDLRTVFARTAWDPAVLAPGPAVLVP